MRCFRCAEVIVELPENDPKRESDCYVYFPALMLEVAPETDVNGPYRCTCMCWACFNEYKPDMWSSESEWMSSNPAVPFDKLPEYDYNDPKEPITNYLNYEAYQPVR